MEFNAHDAKIEILRMYNAGMLTTQEMSHAWDMADYAESDATDARIEADGAEYEFRMFCEDGPGARAADVLASMKATFEHSKRYWKRALASARLRRAAWLAA